MNRFLLIIFVCAIGCAPQTHSTSQPTTRLAAARDDSPPEAFLALDEIQPRPDLEDLKSAAAPTTAPSLDAIELYARARGALGEGQRFNAINLFERALAADPNSFDIRYDLAKA